MRLARNLLLAPTAALVTAAFMAPSASAQSIEIHGEGSAHCNDVAEIAPHGVAGGCLVHRVSEDNTVTFSHSGLSEAVTSGCQSEFTAHIGEDGTGYAAIDDSTISTNPGAGCPITACDEPGIYPPDYYPNEITHPEFPWPIVGFVESGGQVQMIYTFCIRASTLAEGGSGGTCTIAVDVVSVPSTHDQELTADSEPCFENPANEVSGHWLTEAIDDGQEQDIELEHIHYPGS
jgi:hypothetical protein